MPLISDLLPKKEGSKLFQKKTYRPWDDESLISSHKIAIDANSSELFNIDKKNIDVDKLMEVSTTSKSTAYSKNITTKIKDLKINQCSDQDLEKKFRGLFGAQKIILQYILTLIDDKLAEYVITASVSMDEFIIKCNLPPNTVKTMLQKLKHKNLLQTYEYKPGRGGYAKYKLPLEVYDFFMKKYRII